MKYFCISLRIHREIREYVLTMPHSTELLALFIPLPWVSLLFCGSKWALGLLRKCNTLICVKLERILPLLDLQ
jgi:hypothetical protein